MYNVYIRFWPTLSMVLQVLTTCIVLRVGQNRINTPYMTVYLVISLWFPCQKYRIYTVYIWFWPTLIVLLRQCLWCTPQITLSSLHALLHLSAGKYRIGHQRHCGVYLQCKPKSYTFVMVISASQSKWPTKKSTIREENKLPYMFYGSLLIAGQM
jgi:hypothetical protein